MRSSKSRASRRGAFEALAVLHAAAVLAIGAAGCRLFLVAVAGRREEGRPTRTRLQPPPVAAAAPSSPTPPSSPPGDVAGDDGGDSAAADLPTGSNAVERAALKASAMRLIKAVAAADGGPSSSSSSSSASSSRSPSLLADLRLVLEGSPALSEDGDVGDELEEAFRNAAGRRRKNDAAREEEKEERERDEEEEEGEEEEGATAAAAAMQREQREGSCVDESHYADRHLARIHDVFRDHDCLHREFDASSPDFDASEAVGAFEKCHLLVLRNVFSGDVTRELRSRFSQYVGEVYAGRLVKPRGGGAAATTRGGGSFVLHEGHRRWNILPPRGLVPPAVLANPAVLEILGAPTILGDGDDDDDDDDESGGGFVVNHVGNINAEAGARAQGWHADGAHLQGETSLGGWGVAGHDLPPYAVNMFTPLLDVTGPELGPTEFCLGTSNLRGLGGSSAFYHVMDESLLGDGVAEELRDFDSRRRHVNGPCPDGFGRVPLLRMGDVVLVDYMVTHRGGPNDSDRLRSLLFVTYSRRWYHDSNFDISYDEDGNDSEDDGDGDGGDSDDDGTAATADWLTKWTRFALVEKARDDERGSCPDRDDDDDDDESTACQNQEAPAPLPPLESISDFLQAFEGWDDEEVERNYYQDAS